LTVVVALPGTQRAVEVPFTKALEQTDAEHQASHPAAKLVPHRADVSTPAEFQDLVTRAVAERLAAKLETTWRASFCEALEQPEDAARCVRARSAPHNAWVLVARFFGEREETVKALADWSGRPSNQGTGEVGNTL
jgi:hypothetical protein